MPGQLWRAWLWQLDGQCCSVSDHDSREAASVPSCSSEAEPWKAIVSPTFQRRPGLGAAIVATGGVFPAAIATASVALAPPLSVTLSVAV